MCRASVIRASFALLLSLTSSQAALGAGFDTPILYTARHQAMGGTAIASVNDASAGFHNPAGLQGVRGLGLIGDFSLILGKIEASPTPTDNLESETVVAPFFLLGAAFRLEEWLTLGVAGFPVASGGAEYRYSVGRVNPVTWVDSTNIVFFEVTPMLSLNVPRDRFLPGKLAFGAGYRVNYVTFSRERGEPDKLQYLDLNMQGASFTGFRLGLQYQPIDELKLGVVFRNKVVVTTHADSAKVLTADATDAELDFTLPAKLGFGVRTDFGRIGLATDVEWAFQSQNERPPLSGTLMGNDAEVPNVFDWKDGITLRFGAEYRVGPEESFPLRVGYLFDSRVANPAYPSAFGTPPASTRTFTAGAGFVQETWQVNLAVSRRFGSTHVPSSELGEGCSFCGYGGDYALRMTGLYVDASVDLPM
jgi:long-subunit fatty acid transport protein